MNEVVVALIGVAGVIISSIVSAFVAHGVGARQARASERTASAETQQAMNDSFRLLIETFQEERAFLRSEVEGLKGDIQNMSTDIALLTSHVTRLEQELVKNGNIVPPRPVRVRAA